ncbi:hypothetical protein DPMN_167572 [Dreissena polymorpha]|uniref:Uncharacterized protein n=1 Tax=Dreissena polymorpha TaxID=45954 RepID=A0A9D4IYH3_DREPO|nr:hypothetical protein DPMN_167572 [Dreissena polymorpha]
MIRYNADLSEVRDIKYMTEIPPTTFPFRTHLFITLRSGTMPLIFEVTPRREIKRRTPYQRRAQLIAGNRIHLDNGGP